MLEEPVRYCTQEAPDELERCPFKRSLIEERFLADHARNALGYRPELRVASFDEVLLRLGVKQRRLLINGALCIGGGQGGVHACGPMDLAAFQFDDVFPEVDADYPPFDRTNFELGANRQLVCLTLGS